jgi:hypothetical protein
VCLNFVVFVFNFQNFHTFLEVTHLNLVCCLFLLFQLIFSLGLVNFEVIGVGRC